MDLFEVGVCNVGIDLGGGNAAVAKHSLNAAYVGAIH